MTGKGSGRRPMKVSQTEFEAQWDLIFGGKNMKHEHQRGIITEEVERALSVNGRREAVIVKTERGYMVECYEKKNYIKTVDVTNHSLYYARDTAENWTTGIIE